MAIFLLDETIVIFDNLSMLAHLPPKILRQHDKMKQSNYRVYGILRPISLHLYDGRLKDRQREDCVKAMIEDMFEKCIYVYSPSGPNLPGSKYIAILRRINAVSGPSLNRSLLYSMVRESSILLIDDEGIITSCMRKVPVKNISSSYITSLSNCESPRPVDELTSEVLRRLAPILTKYSVTPP